jgi:hypothetical protein
MCAFTVVHLAKPCIRWLLVISTTRKGDRRSHGVLTLATNPYASPSYHQHRVLSSNQQPLHSPGAAPRAPAAHDTLLVINIDQGRENPPSFSVFLVNQLFDKGKKAHICTERHPCSSHLIFVDAWFAVVLCAQLISFPPLMRYFRWRTLLSNSAFVTTDSDRHP